MPFRVFIDPYDNFIMRDGRPFNQDDAGRASASSLFPPPPDTLYGAVRVGIARSRGWDGEGGWSSIDALNKDLGSWSDPGTFKIAGPFFSIAGKHVLPFPAHVYARVNEKKGEVSEIVALRPENIDLETDAGDLQLLGMPKYSDGFKDIPLTGRYADVGIIRKILDGKQVGVQEIVSPESQSGNRKTILMNAPVRLPGWGSDALAATEMRIGVARDNATRLVEDGQLYASVRRQLRRGVTMYVEVEGATADSKRMPEAVPFGSEGRFASLSTDGAQFRRDNKVPSGKRLLIYLSTPLMLDPGDSDVGIWSRIAGLPGRVVAAAITGVSSQAGFVRKSGDARRAMTASRHVLAAGSVLFVERVSANGELPDRLGAVDTHRMGYGMYLTGVRTAVRN